MFFYSIALPFCITANILNFYNFTHIHKTNSEGNSIDDKSSRITKFIKKFIPKYNNSMKEDVVEALMIFYSRIYHEENFREDNDWRA